VIPPHTASRGTRLGVALVVLVAALAIRIQGITTAFWMLRDQTRDWEIVQGSFMSLPLVGPGTHVGGYTIGPAFYWILWGIRVLFGPWFDYLPHSGGIGQAVLGSAVDAILLLAIWRRIGSGWIAATVVTLLVTAGFDLSLAGVIWNPVVGSTLARLAMALVLFDWHRGSPGRVAATAAVAVMSVHAYTGAVYVAVTVFALIVLTPLLDRNWTTLRQNASVAFGAALLLQGPYVLHQVKTRFESRAMGAVTGSVMQVMTGRAAPEVAKSVRGYLGAVTFIEMSPWTFAWTGVLLLVCGAVVAWRYRHDPAIIAITLAPQVLAIPGYALFLATLDHYYYLSLMPSAVLTVVLAITALPWPRAATAVSIACCVSALAIVPARIRFGLTMNRMPAYHTLVQASRVLVNRHVPMRDIRTEFRLEPTVDPAFLYRLLGGRLDPASRWIAVIDASGRVTYQHLGGS
jgi:hypothetical protein